MSNLYKDLCLTKREIREIKAKAGLPMTIAMFPAFAMTCMSVSAEGDTSSSTGGILGQDGTLMAVLNSFADGIRPLLIPVAVVSGIICIICWMNPFSSDSRIWTQRLFRVFIGVFIACILGQIFTTISDATGNASWTSANLPTIN